MIQMVGCKSWPRSEDNATVSIQLHVLQFLLEDSQRFSDENITRHRGLDLRLAMRTGTASLYVKK